MGKNKFGIVLLIALILFQVSVISQITLDRDETLRLEILVDGQPLPANRIVEKAIAQSISLTIKDRPGQYNWESTNNAFISTPGSASSLLTLQLPGTAGYTTIVATDPGNNIKDAFTLKVGNPTGELCFDTVNGCSSGLVPNVGNLVYGDRPLGRTCEQEYPRYCSPVCCGTSGTELIGVYTEKRNSFNACLSYKAEKKNVIINDLFNKFLRYKIGEGAWTPPGPTPSDLSGLEQSSLPALKYVDAAAYDNDNDIYFSGTNVYTYQKASQAWTTTELRNYIKKDGSGNVNIAKVDAALMDESYQFIVSGDKVYSRGKTISDVNTPWASVSIRGNTAFPPISGIDSAFYYKDEDLSDVPSGGMVFNPFAFIVTKGDTWRIAQPSGDRTWRSRNPKVVTVNKVGNELEFNAVSNSGRPFERVFIDGFGSNPNQNVVIDIFVWNDYSGPSPRISEFSLRTTQAGFHIGPKVIFAFSDSNGVDIDVPLKVYGTGPINERITWSSDNADVVQIDPAGRQNGKENTAKLKAGGRGLVKITASAGSNTADMYVNVMRRSFYSITNNENLYVFMPDAALPPFYNWMSGGAVADMAGVNKRFTQIGAAGYDRERGITVILPVCTASVNAPAGCFDSDGSSALTTAGFVQTASGTFYDACRSDGSLIEYSCSRPDATEAFPVAHNCALELGQGYECATTLNGIGVCSRGAQASDSQKTTLSNCDAGCTDADGCICPSGCARSGEITSGNCGGQSAQQCTNSQTQGCGSDVGICQAGTQTCSNNQFGSCTGAVTGSTESCDSLDNNCNGVADEGCTGVTGLPVITAMSANPMAGIAPLAIQFTSRAVDPDNTVVTYSWNFGDGTAAVDGREPRHTFSQAGSYEVTLTARSGSEQAQGKLIINAWDGTTRRPPSAVIETIDPARGRAPLNVRFVGNGQDPDGGAVSYSWAFGDGATASGKDVTHSYAREAAFNVELTVTDDESQASKATGNVIVQGTVAALQIETNSINVQAGAQAEVRIVNPGQPPYQFRTTNADIATASAANNVITIRGLSQGSNTITVVDGAGSEASIAVTVTGTAATNAAPVISSIGSTIESGNAPLTAMFSVTATDADNDALTYLWTFGDGSTSAQEDPQHTFTAAGTYNVLLAVSDGRGGTITRTVRITVSSSSGTPPQPNAVPVISSIEAAPSSGNLPLAVTFSTTATDADNDALAYSWTFGDGSTSTQEDPQHTFTAEVFLVRIYSVVLIVNDGRGGTATRTVQVTVTTPLPGTSSGITITSSGSASSVNVGSTLQMTATGGPGTGAYTWTTGSSSIATVNANGLVTGVAAGSVRIFAARGGSSAEFGLTITAAQQCTSTADCADVTCPSGTAACQNGNCQCQPSAAAGELQVSPSEVIMLKNTNMQFTASGGTSPYAWTSLPPSGLSAIINILVNTGATTRVDARNQGTARLIATDAQSASGNSFITVEDRPSGFRLSPTSASISAGSSIGMTTVSGTNVQWGVDNANLLTFPASCQGNSQCTFTGAGAGTATVTATSSATTREARITVEGGQQCTDNAGCSGLSCQTGTAGCVSGSCQCVVANLDSISAAPATFNLFFGQTQALTVTAGFDNGGSSVVTNSAICVSNATNILGIVANEACTLRANNIAGRVQVNVSYIQGDRIRSLLVRGEVRPPDCTNGARRQCIPGRFTPQPDAPDTIFTYHETCDAGQWNNNCLPDYTLGIRPRPPLPACTPGQNITCPKQLGACAGTVLTCGDNGQYPFAGCTDALYTEHANSLGMTYGANDACGDFSDNDCDGSIDEGCACSDGTRTDYCGTDAGACSRGSQSCVQNDQGLFVWSECAGGVKPAPEMPGDNIDNDCDGAIDEGTDCGFRQPLGSARSCSIDFGICVSGIQTCTNETFHDAIMWGVCENVVLPQFDRCGDNLDNDCDNVADQSCGCAAEGLTRSCGAGAGACTAGESVCVQGEWSTCQNAVAPVAEVCGDSIDNDCDGQADEQCPCENQGTQVTTRLCSNQDGVCINSTQQCLNSVWQDCNYKDNNSSYEKKEHSCSDNLDNDCNGKADQNDERCGISSEEECSDSTKEGACSANKPRFCSDGQLTFNSAECGCPAGQVPKSDGTCESERRPLQCGDGTCQITESCSSCPQDCGSCPATGDRDSDTDGWTDQVEKGKGTNIYNIDTDSDGVNDPADKLPLCNEDKICDDKKAYPENAQNCPSDCKPKTEGLPLYLWIILIIIALMLAAVAVYLMMPRKKAAKPAETVMPDMGVKRPIFEIKKEMEEHVNIRQLIDYVKVAIQNGVKKDEIISAAKNVGWTDKDIARAFAQAKTAKHGNTGQLQGYVADSISKGAGRAEIRQRLLKVGWNEKEVDDALKNVTSVEKAGLKTQQQEMIETYIKKHLAKGISRDKIKQALIKAKWDEREIEDAFKAAGLQKLFVKNMQPKTDMTKASAGKKKQALDDVIGKSKKG